MVDVIHHAWLHGNKSVKSQQKVVSGSTFIQFSIAQGTTAQTWSWYMVLMAYKVGWATIHEWYQNNSSIFD
jgi:hypothetical protein